MASPQLLLPLPAHTEPLVDPRTGVVNPFWFNWFRTLEQLFRNPDVAAFAPPDAAYIVAALSASLTQERLLVGGTGITLVDGGANGNLVINAAAQAGVLQVLQTEYTATTVLTPALANTDVVPTTANGTQILSQSITLANAANKVLAEFSGFGGIGGVNVAICAALFRGSTCLNTVATTAPSASTSMHFGIDIIDTPGSVGPHTYTVNVGPATTAGSLRMNSNSAARVHGGAARATLTLTEIKG